MIQHVEVGLESELTTPQSCEERKTIEQWYRRADMQRIAEWFQTHNTDVFNDPEPFAPSFNVAPQTFQPVVRLDPGSGERELTFMRWGLVPFWSKDGTAAFNTINAKAETVATSSALDGKAQRLSRRIREYAMKPQSRTSCSRDDYRIRDTAC